MTMDIKSISEVEDKFFIGIIRQQLRIFKFQRFDADSLSIVINAGNFENHENVLSNMTLNYRYKNLYNNSEFFCDDIPFYFYDTAMDSMLEKILDNIDFSEVNSINLFVHNEKLIITEHDKNLILANRKNGFIGVYNRIRMIDNIIEYMFALNGFDNLKVNFKNTQWKE